MKILGIDVGRTGGWCFNEKIDGQEFDFYGEIKFKSPARYVDKVRELIFLYKPTHMITCMPVRMHNVIASQNRMIGMLQYLCDKYSVELIIQRDNVIRKEILGTITGGNFKEAIMENYNQKSEHIADAMMFCDYLEKTLDN